MRASDNHFVGNILALTSITLTTGTVLTGRALARNGAVTLDNNNVTVCSGGPGFPPPVPVVAIPTLSGWAMIVMTTFLLLSALGMMRRRAALAPVAAKSKR